MLQDDHILHEMLWSQNSTNVQGNWSESTFLWNSLIELANLKIITVVSFHLVSNIKVAFNICYSLNSGLQRFSVLDSSNFLLFWAIREEWVWDEWINVLTFWIEHIQICLISELELRGQLFTLTIEHLFVFVDIWNSSKIVIDTQDTSTSVILTSSTSSTSHLKIFFWLKNLTLLTVEFLLLSKDDGSSWHIKTNSKSWSGKNYSQKIICEKNLDHFF